MEWVQRPWPAHAKTSEGVAPTEREVRQGNVTDHVGAAWWLGGQRQREARGTLHEGRRQIRAWVRGMGLGTTTLAESSMSGPPPAEESGEGMFSRGGDEDGRANRAQSGTSGWAGSVLSPLR